MNINPTIFIGVTFRDFIGSENDHIQRLFLGGIQKQTYRNWKLVVTIFNEKNDRHELEQKKHCCYLLR